MNYPFKMYWGSASADFNMKVDLMKEKEDSLHMTL